MQIRVLLNSSSSISSSLHLVISHPITMVRMENMKTRWWDWIVASFQRVLLLFITMNALIYDVLCCNIGNLEAGSAIARLLENLVVDCVPFVYLMAFYLFCCSFPLSPLNHTIKWNALTEISSAIFIDEVGHLMIRYDAIFSRKNTLIAF